LIGEKTIYKGLPFFLGALGMIFGLGCYYIETCFTDASHFAWWFAFFTVQTATGIAIGLLLKRLYFGANTDSLTELANRAFFYKSLDKHLHNPAASGLSLVLIDLDNFKSINDTYGHLAGDAALRKLANLLRAHAPQKFTVARIGGDEFAIILPATDLTAAQELAETIRQAAANELKECNLTLSLGVTHVTGETRPDQIVTQADTALYRAKNSKNTVSHFYQTMSAGNISVV